MHCTDFALSSQTTGNLFSYGIRPVSPHIIKLQAVWTRSRKIIHKYILRNLFFIYSYIHKIFQVMNKVQNLIDFADRRKHFEINFLAFGIQSQRINSCASDQQLWQNHGWKPWQHLYSIWMETIILIKKQWTDFCIVFQMQRGKGYNESSLFTLHPTLVRDKLL